MTIEETREITYIFIVVIGNNIFVSFIINKGNVVYIQTLPNRTLIGTVGVT